MIFAIGVAFIVVGWLMDEGWPGMLLGGGLVVVGAVSYLDGVL